MSELNGYRGRRVAVVAAGAVTGDVGGAERFYVGLRDALIAQGCEVDLIAVPTDESNFDAILGNYARCRELDLSAYDLAISTKAPTYAVRHPRHVVYLVHTVRVFYDMFETAFPVPTAELFEQRRQIQDMDKAALASVKRRFAIGYEVASRLSRWNVLDAEVLHPPLATVGFRTGEAEDYFFLPGRLHPWKRVDLAIRAVMSSSLPLRLLIAGTGEAEASLRQLAAGDNRINFLGRISEEELIDRYSRCLAVLFVPMREDYGYVTLEAFSSGKPVITCRDSGEVLQFVAHQKTGWVCDPTPDSLCEALENCFSNKTLAGSLGAEGARVAARITWPAVARRLLAAGFEDEAAAAPATERSQGSMRVAVLDMQPIDPPVGGGRLRLLGLYHALGDDVETRYVGTYDWPGEPFRRHQLTPSLEEIDIPLSDAHHAAARQLSAEAGGKTVIDIAFPRQAHLSPDYIAAAREAIDWGEVVIFSHPWVYPLVADRLRRSQLVAYDSHNVEGFLRAQVLDTQNPVERDLLREVVEAEYQLGCRADLVLACSHEDRERFARIYEWPDETMRLVPNGVMSRAIVPASPVDRAESRRLLGIKQDARVAIFLGSPYGPNLEAARFITDALAPALPEVTFAIVGGAGDQLQRSAAPNVRVTGFVDAAAKILWLQVADLAVNPMFSGSGTNIKMFDFMAAGLPVVSSPAGARGIAGESARGVQVVDERPRAFIDALRTLAGDEALRLLLGRQARAAVEEWFSWETISPRLGDLLRGAWQGHRAGRERRTRVAMLSTWNVRCGIAEHASYLAAALQECGCEVLALANELPAAGPAGPLPEMLVPCVRVWTWDNFTWTASRIDMDKVRRVLERWRPDLLVIQHHTGFLGTADYAALLRVAEDVGLPVLVEAHNARELADCAVEAWPDGGQTRFWVHDDDERELLQQRTTIKVLTEPLPVLVPRSRRECCSRAVAAWDGPVLGGFGFLRPHKGVKRAIGIVAELKAHYPGARYLGLHAAYDTGGSGGYLEECLDEARRLGVGDSVRIDTAFLPIDEAIERLSAVDAVLLPYEPSIEGASATANVAVAAGRPIFTSASLIFKPLKDVVVMVESQDPKAWAVALSRLLDSKERIAAQEAKVRRWAEQHSYREAARRLLAHAGGVQGAVTNTDEHGVPPSVPSVKKQPPEAAQ